jgi:hypothetical protein
MGVAMCVWALAAQLHPSKLKAANAPTAQRPSAAQRNGEGAGSEEVMLISIIQSDA